MSTLSSAEQSAVEAEQAKQRGEPMSETEAAEQETGTTAIPRTLSDPNESDLDPRFDRDDLRQGKPPPAARNHHIHAPNLSSVGKLPGQALRVPGKGLKKIRKTVVGKDGKKQEVEVEEEVEEQEGQEDHEHKTGLLSRVLHGHK